MFKKIGLSVVAALALMAFVAPAPAQAGVRFGVAVGPGYGAGYGYRAYPAYRYPAYPAYGAYGYAPPAYGYPAYGYPAYAYPGPVVGFGYYGGHRDAYWGRRGYEDRGGYGYRGNGRRR
jgi:hypothetical protein